MFLILFSVFGGLLAGAVLAMFGADVALINILQPFFPEIELTREHYFVAFGVLGLLLGTISFVKRK